MLSCLFFFSFGPIIIIERKRLPVGAFISLQQCQETATLTRLIFKYSKNANSWHLNPHYMYRVLHASAVECQSMSLITFDQHSINLDQYLSNISIDTQLSVGQHMAECPPTHMYRSTLDGLSAKIIQLLTDMSIEYRSSVNQVLIESQSHQGLIDTQQWMTLVHMILLEVHNLLMKLVFI